MSDVSPPSVRSTTGTRRSEAARIAVLHAADDLVAEVGFARVTVEGIAARAGVGKQTIYRWWSSKVDVLLDCLLEDSTDKLPLPDTGDLAGDLCRWLSDFCAFVSQDDCGQVLRALLGEAQHDPVITAALRERYLAGQEAAGRELLARAGLTDEADDVVQDLLAPVYHRLLVTGAALDDATIDRIVARALR